MLQVRLHSDAVSFLHRAEVWLSNNEAEHNILLGVAYLLTEQDAHFEPPFYLATVETEAGVDGCAICSPPDGLYLSPMPSAAIPAIVDQLAISHADIPEVIGPEDVAMQFARRWRPQGWVLHSRLWRYTVHRAQPPLKPAPGALRCAESADLDRIDGWASAYAAEVGTKVDVDAFFRRMVERRSLYLWDDGGPRCAVTVSGLTRNGARISSVYTPPPFRRRGYAENAVAAVSKLILDDGKRFCVITADVDDPTPNGIYRRLGFERGNPFVQIHFS